jgi:hypothetical protein
MINIERSPGEFFFTLTRLAIGESPSPIRERKKEAGGHCRNAGPVPRQKAFQTS